MRLRYALFGAMVMGLLPAKAADWQPARGPLQTRWARDVTPERVLPEYPRPQMVRNEWLNLNGVWELGFARKGNAAPVGKPLAERILVPFPVESALSGVMRHADRLWYRRSFQVPQSWSGQRVLLHLGAIDWEAVVWINGKELATHRGGYDAFTVDVTDALRSGGSGDQELIVGVWDPTSEGTQPRGKQVLKPGGIYYTPTTGIWQTVWLEPVPASYVQSVRIVPDVDTESVRIQVNPGGEAAGLTAVVTALDGDSLVGRAEGSPGKEISLAIPRPKLWSPDTPFLYNLRIELRRGEERVDGVASYFGMRKVALGKDEKGITRIMLNGNPLFQVGPLDQGFWPDGLYTAPTDEALRYDIEITKQLGFNTTRKHVKVEPERWYYWCDRLGLLVWQDMPSGDASSGLNQPEIARTPASTRQFEAELKAMIEGRFNHPSIILWVVFNEGWGQSETARLTAWTKSLDPTRLADCASGWNDVPGAGDVHDIHVYPGPGSPAPEPARAAVLGEFGGLGLGVDGHTWTAKTWGYRGTASQDDLTRKYERLLARAWALKDQPGLSAAIYTQITDVESEANGLLTYDRAIIKVDPGRVVAVNQGHTGSIPIVREVVPTSREAPQTWRYTLTQPPADWSGADFDASAWQEAKGGFGTRGTPGAVIRTEWASPDIWLRREFRLPEGDTSPLVLLIHHDEDAEIYLNGVLAAKLTGYGTEYEEIPIRAEARAALRPGSNNLLGVHCHQTRGGQFIDVGLGRLETRGR